MGSISIDREGFLANVFLARKGPCRAATTASITLVGEQTIDGVAIVADDRVLVKNQSDNLNGIYICKTGAWELADDFDQRGHVAQGTNVLVYGGTTNALTEWVVTTSGRPYPGRDAIAFARLMNSDIASLTATRGDLITGGASDWQNLAIGTSGYHLQSDGTDAAWAGFLQSGTSAVTRAWQEKLREGFFSVKDFGAVGDGVTDDTAAILAAIAAADAFTVTTLPSVTGFIAAVVYFPKGNYLHTGISSTKPHHFIGDSKSATFLKLAAGSDTHFWTHSLPGTVAGPTSGQHYFQQPVFQDMSWDCNKANQTGTCLGLNLSSTAWTITTTYAVGAIVDRMEIYNAKGSGISIGSNRNLGIIKDTIIKGCDSKGVSNNAYDWRIYNIDIGTSLYGYSQDAAGGTTIWGANIYQNTERGVNIENGVNTYVWFAGCSFDLNGQYGAVVSGNSDQETFQVSFDQCRFNGNGSDTDNTYADILAQNCYGLTVANSMFYAQGSNRPAYALQTSGGGPVLWSNNHYRTSGGTQPWATALTNDFTKLQMAGDRETILTKDSSGRFVFNTALLPSANDGAALGVSGTAWSDIFLASGAVLNFNASNYTVTHSAGSLAFSGGASMAGTLSINGTAEFFTGVNIAETEDGANAGPYFVQRRISASPAANDRIGAWLAKARDAGGTERDYAGFEAQITDPSTGVHRGAMHFQTANAGSVGNRLTISGLNVVAPINGAALSTAATDGLLYIPTSTAASTAAPIGTPTAFTGSVPLLYNTAQNRLWIYNGAWRSVALTT
jgi:hypothetical protein